MDNVYEVQINGRPVIDELTFEEAYVKADALAKILPIADITVRKY